MLDSSCETTALADASDTIYGIDVCTVYLLIKAVIGQPLKKNLTFFGIVFLISYIVVPDMITLHMYQKHNIIIT